MWAWQWIVVAAIFPLSFFLHCLARPLAATIDPQVELMTKLTNPWGVRVREIKRKMEWKRPRPAHCMPSSPRPLWKVLHTMQRCHIYAVRGLFFMGVIQEVLARPWHGARGADRWCCPNSAARPPTRQELSARAAEDPGPCREHEPVLALTTAPITGAELIVPLVRRVGEVGPEVKEHEDSIYCACFNPIQKSILGLQ